MCCSCSEEDILKELEELSLETQGGKTKVSTPGHHTDELSSYAGKITMVTDSGPAKVLLTDQWK